MNNISFVDILVLVDLWIIFCKFCYEKLPNYQDIQLHIYHKLDFFIEFDNQRNTYMNIWNTSLKVIYYNTWIESVETTSI